MTGRIAVVGAGMAGVRFAERYAALGGRAEATVYGAEPCAPYNRVLLADVLAGRYDASGIGLPAGPAVLRTGAEVTAVDTGARTLRLACGESAAYDVLVLATGAEPVVPPVRGLRAPSGAFKGGVHTLRTLDDCRRLAKEAAGGGRAVVVGGGVLGVSTACALAALGLSVEIIQQAPHLVERHLDAQAGAVLRSGLARLGVAVRLGTEVRALRGAERVTGVELSDGTLLPADLVVPACGVRPRTGLALAAGLPVRAGVVVDDALRCGPGVYAIGDCAEHRGVVHDHAGPAWEQADVLAARLSGAAPDAVYGGSRPRSRLTAGPLEYAVFGEAAEPDPGLEVLRLADATRGSYKKLVLRDGRVVGGILLGDLATVGALARAYERAAPPPADVLHLMTGQGA